MAEKRGKPQTKQPNIDKNQNFKTANWQLVYFTESFEI
jgi:hypothetical protein